MRWAAEYAAQIGNDREVHTLGISIKPLYTPLDVDALQFDADVGFPGSRRTRAGSTPTHGTAAARGRNASCIGWARRKPNARLRDILDQGASAVADSMQFGVPRL